MLLLVTRANNLYPITPLWTPVTSQTNLTGCFDSLILTWSNSTFFLSVCNHYSQKAQNEMTIPRSVLKGYVKQTLHLEFRGSLSCEVNIFSVQSYSAPSNRISKTSICINTSSYAIITAKQHIFLQLVKCLSVCTPLLQRKMLHEP